MAILPGNPYQTSARTGSFHRYTDGVFQGMAVADPAVQNALNMGQISPSGNAPLWGGLPISETVYAGTLGPNKTVLTAAASNAAITGFSVFDQGHNGVITPGPNNVPLFYPGMDLPFYRFGSGARIPVQASSSLLSLVGGTILPSVTWNFATEELVPTSAGTSVAVTSIAVSGSANPYTGLVTTATAHGLNVGDTVTLAGFTPSGYNGTTYEVLSASFTTTTFTIQLATNPGAVTTAGTVAVTAGTGTLSIKLLSVHSNSRIVFNDPVSGNIYWNDGLAAIIQL